MIYTARILLFST